MLKKLASIRSLFVMALAIGAVGTNAEVFEFCNSGPELIITKCARNCQGNDATCRFVSGPTFWCETGWGICEYNEPIYSEWSYLEYYCTPNLGGCKCLAGTVVDEGVQWVITPHC